MDVIDADIVAFGHVNLPVMAFTARLSLGYQGVRWDALEEVSYFRAELHACSARLWHDQGALSSAGRGQRGVLDLWVSHGGGRLASGAGTAAKPLTARPTDSKQGVLKVCDFRHLSLPQHQVDGALNAFHP
ncbi:hypothetical protein [Streptomyces sp. YS-3]|uniref:hypothetical protein n=1 Tax=Streptomyces sp. YS-3 TaxID=3381352 RepID=UPI0038628417